MKFATFRRDGESRLGVVQGDYLVDISEMFDIPVPDLGAFLSRNLSSRFAEIEDYAAAAASSARLTLDQDYLPPIPNPGKIMCLGLNYRDHAAEIGMPIPDLPIVFARVAGSLAGHNQPIRLNPLSTQFDFEGEVAAVIGRRARAVPREQALDYVFGYAPFNDLTYRDYQLRTPQWTIGKNFDGTGPFGPLVVTADELPLGARGLRIVTRINGTTVQDGNTENMIFDVAESIAQLSQTMTLEPGDLIMTGTPAGVGAGRKPPLWLKAGDRCEVEVEGIGTLSNEIVQYD